MTIYYHFFCYYECRKGVVFDMENLTYVTGNYGKYVSVKEKFETLGIAIHYFKYDFEEPNVNDISFISKEKARGAYDKVKSPVFVKDTGFYIEHYPNHPEYPGAFVKRSGIGSHVDALLEVMKDVKARDCYFLDCLTFYDGEEFYQFFGESRGRLSYEIRGTDKKEAISALWQVFIPDHCDKTLAEMTKQERSKRPDNRTDATSEFILWYQIQYLSNSFLLTRK